MPTGPTEGPQVWRYHGKGLLTPSSHTWPSPFCTSALGLSWALGHRTAAHSHHPACLSSRACLLPGALLAFVREQGTGSKAPGYLPSAGAPLTGLLCPAFARLPHLWACSTRAAPEGSRGLPHPPHPTLPPASSPHSGILRSWFSDSPPPSARGRISLNPGLPALKLTASPKGPL